MLRSSSPISLRGKGSNVRIDVDAYGDFDSVKSRLDEIVTAVSNDELPLDDALDLYEEAVALGMRASDLLEVGLEVDEQPQEGAAEADGSQPADAQDAAGNQEEPASANTAE